MSLSSEWVGRRPRVGSLRQLLDGVDIQLNVIGALILRELHTRYGRENIGYLWMLAEPMMLAISVASIHAGSHTHYGSDIATIPFALGGYCTFMIFRSIVTRGESTLIANQPLLYHRSVTIFDMLFARAILEGASTFLAFMILLAGAWALGLGDPPARPLVLVCATVLITWFSFCISMFVCWGGNFSHLVNRFLHPITYILMPLSGCFFMLKWIPQPYRSWLEWFPLTQIFEMVRYGQFETCEATYINIIYILGFCMLMTWGGLVSLRVTRRHIHLH